MEDTEAGARHVLEHSGIVWKVVELCYFCGSVLKLGRSEMHKFASFLGLRALDLILSFPPHFSTGLSVLSDDALLS
jgi:hypothetical protein